MLQRLPNLIYPHAAGDAPAAPTANGGEPPAEPGPAQPVPEPQGSAAKPTGTAAPGLSEPAAEGDRTPDPAAEDCDTPEALAEVLRRAVDEGALRAQQEALQAMAQRSGLPQERLAELLQAARQRQQSAEAPLPPQVRERLIAAEVKSVGTDMGLLDADAAARLMDPAAISVDAHGAVTGVREALAALKNGKGYLFAPAARGAWAQRMGGGASPIGGVEEAFYRKNPALRK